jgi:hypothetical protein
MISSRTVVNADIFSETHRISGRIICPASGLVGLLNDSTTSLIDIEDAYYSRLQQPAKITTHLELAHLSKAHLIIIVLARREDLGPHGVATGGFSRRNPINALVTTPEYEVQGTLEVTHKFDAAELLVGGTGRFIQVYNAAAVATLFPETTFSGAAILVNRARIEMIAPTARSKA